VAAPTASELGAFVGREVNAEQADAVISVVTAQASAYTRGQGFTDGEPNTDVRAVILSASARLITDATQITSQRQMGPFSVAYRTGFDGWSTSELYTLNRYRQRAA
jgi:hypothetical protein